MRHIIVNIIVISLAFAWAWASGEIDDMALAYLPEDAE